MLFTFHISNFTIQCISCPKIFWQCIALYAIYRTIHSFKLMLVNMVNIFNNSFTLTFISFDEFLSLNQSVLLKPIFSNNFALNVTTVLAKIKFSGLVVSSTFKLW